MGESCRPDRHQAERFLAALDPQARTFSFRTFSDTPYTRLPGADPLEAELLGSLGDCWTALVKLNRAGAAVCVRVNADGPAHSSESVGRFRALFADVDRPLAAAERSDLTPHLIVRSSPGHLHLYWLVENLPVGAFRAAQTEIARRCRADRRACALNQALRLPGFWHRKDPRRPCRVRLVRLVPEPAYRLQDLILADLVDPTHPEFALQTG